jgi:3-hydroxyisobutyrate dehydrogenase-like beta-hydroxyacid dehydrogenase
MGHSMLKHLVKHGYQVTACDVSAEALGKAREAGAKTADSPAALAKQCDFVILGVGYTPEVEAVVYGDGGLLANLAKGAIIAVSSTTSPYVVQEIARRADLPRPFRRR